MTNPKVVKNSLKEYLHNVYKASSDFKEIMDSVALVKDLLEIRWLLDNCDNSDIRVQRKLDYLDYKYGKYINGLYSNNLFFRNWCLQISNRELLMFYFRNLPFMAGTEFVRNKAISLSGEYLLFGYVR